MNALKDTIRDIEPRPVSGDPVELELEFSNPTAVVDFLELLARRLRSNKRITIRIG